MNTPLAIFAASSYLVFWATGRIAERFSPAPLAPPATFLLAVFSAGSAAVLAFLADGVLPAGCRMDSYSDAGQVAAALGATSLIVLTEKRLNLLGRHR